MTHALNTFYCTGEMFTTVNPDTIGFVWTAEFDLNTLRVDEEIFESGKKKLRIQKYPDMCGQGLTYSLQNCRIANNIEYKIFPLNYLHLNLKS